MLTIVGDHDAKTIEQMRNCLAVEEGALGVLCADGHLGYAQPVGGAVAYRDHISVSGVGYDIGCGNKAVETNLLASDLGEGDMIGIMDEVVRRVSFGIGPNHGEQAPDHGVIDEIAKSPVKAQRDMVEKARDQLSTVGGGNHYVDIFRCADDDKIWVGVHFGSRGFGHTTATHFLEAAGGEGEGGMMATPVVLPADSALGGEYIEGMEIAGRYAYAGRNIVVDRVLDILGARNEFEVHNHHNFAWREKHFGEDFWVVRKGCTPAFPGQMGFVGATMAEDSVILRGAGAINDAAPFGTSVYKHQEELLYSTVHGAGRQMSRTEAAGKKRKRWTCSNRDCDWVQPPGTHKPQDNACPSCGDSRLRKAWIQESGGKIDWNAALRDLEAKNIERRGGAADEAPGAYKRLNEVLEYHGDTITVVRVLEPLGVAMAGPGIKADD